MPHLDEQHPLMGFLWSFSERFNVRGHVWINVSVALQVDQCTCMITHTVFSPGVHTKSLPIVSLKFVAFVKMSWSMSILTWI